MKREIEFRCWDKKSKCWRYWDIRKDCMCDLLVYGHLDLDTLGEFTSRLDKNGKKIFEEDILRIWSDYYHNDSCERVFWDDHDAAWRHTYRDRPSKAMWDKSEVIGNIWETEVKDAINLR